MFELIGILVVCWIGYSMIKGFSKAASTVRSQEFGKEARHIATRELGVPESYYHQLVVTRIEEVKDFAVRLRERVAGLHNVSWPRLLAITVYVEFRQDCVQWRRGSRVTEQLFDRLGISAVVVADELGRDDLAVLETAAGVALSPLVTDSITDDELKQLMVRCVDRPKADRSFPKLSYGRVDRFITSQETGGEWFPDYRGARFYIDIAGAEYSVYVKTIDPSQESDSGVVLHVDKYKDMPESDLQELEKWAENPLY